MLRFVGLVGNARYQTLRETPWPLIYLPAKQTENSGFTLIVRTMLPASVVVPEIERTVRAVDSRLPTYDVHALQEQIDQGISSERVLSFLSTLFSALATLLCSMGIYGTHCLCGLAAHSRDWREVCRGRAKDGCG